MNDARWTDTVILVDADYVDKVAFDLTVNFERMIGRRIPQADMARWLECVALDGGLRPQQHNTHDTQTIECPHDAHPTHDTHNTHPTPQIQVVLLYSHDEMRNFRPGRMADLDGKAFQSELGEFLISCVRVEEMVRMDQLFIDSLQVLGSAAEVNRLVVVPNAEEIYNKVRETLRHADQEKRVTLLAMQPMEGGPFRQEILGYSLMAALGISADEIKG